MNECFPSRGPDGNPQIEFVFPKCGNGSRFWCSCTSPYIAVHRSRHARGMPQACLGIALHRPTSPYNIALHQPRAANGDHGWRKAATGGDGRRQAVTIGRGQRLRLVATGGRWEATLRLAATGANGEWRSRAALKGRPATQESGLMGVGAGIGP